MIYSAIQYILENDATVKAEVGLRSDGSNYKIFPIHPALEESLPFITYSILSQTGNPTKDTDRGMDTISVRISCMDTELTDVVDLSDAVRSAMETYMRDGDTINGENIASIDFVSLSDDFNESYGDRGAYVINLDYEIYAS